MDTSERAGIAAAVAAAFDLGAVLGPLRSVPGGRSHLLWQLRTDTGAWAVKQLNRSREPWWLADHLAAAGVEEAAFRAGVAMPRPVPPLRPADGMLADLPIGGSLVSFLVHEWCAGQPLADVGVPAAVADWAGATLATLHTLPATGGNTYPVHPVTDWAAWLRDAADDAGFLAAVRDYLPDVARAVEIVRSAVATRGSRTAVSSHRDVKPDNVLLTPTTPVLVDWDGAGPEVAEWEVTRAALAFSRTGTGWDAAQFGRTLDAYRAAGGRPVPADETAFAGLFRTQLGGAAWLLWRALGHRPVSPAERSAAHGHALETLADMRSSLSRLSTWTRWLAS
ncbi:MAG: hypothetical protein V7637_4715 [Mycobacteriales bacterium]